MGKRGSVSKQDFLQEWARSRALEPRCSLLAVSPRPAPLRISTHCYALRLGTSVRERKAESLTSLSKDGDCHRRLRLPSRRVSASDERVLLSMNRRGRSSLAPTLFDASRIPASSSEALLRRSMCLAP